MMAVNFFTKKGQIEMKILAGLMTGAALASALVFAPTPASAACQTAEHIVGGWMVSADSAKLTRADKKLFSRAMEERKASGAECITTYEPLLRLGTQVVAGTNYAYLCRTEGERPELVIVYIYENLSGELEILSEKPLELGI